jgi:hypothetical protein
MKCSSCYAENPPWAAVCQTCGGAVQPLEFCPGGHLLPPGVRECPVCPSEWPETPVFEGPPILRGLLWVERGRLLAIPAAGGDDDRSYIELRDDEAPLNIGEDTRGRARLFQSEDPAVTVRIVVRPSGVLVCQKGGASPAVPLAYVPLAAGGALDLGNTRLRLLTWPVPAWVEKA